MVDLKKDESVVKSALLDEEKLVIREFTDSEKLEKAYKDKKYEAIGALVVAISDDENKLSLAHPVLLRKIADWKGDFEKELRVTFGDDLSAIDAKITSSGIKGVKEIYALLREIYDLEKQVQPIFDNSKLLCADAKQKFGNVTVNSAQSTTYDAIAKEVKELHDAFLKWIVLDKKLDDLIVKADTHIKEYSARSPELQNYSDLGKHFSDIIAGAGKYASMTFRDRQAIVTRWMNSNLYNVNANAKLVKQMQDFLKTGDFGDLPKPEDIENPKHDEWMYFNDSLKRIKDKFGTNAKHLTPVQYFAIAKRAENNIADPYRKIFENLFSGKGEWLSMAVKLEDGQLHVALDPENLAWKKDHYEVVGKSIACSSLNKYSANGLKPGWNANVSGFTNIFGDGCRGIYLSEGNNWWPVWSNNSVNKFNLYANVNKRASRGVR